jgi:hypothetical protein
MRGIVMLVVAVMALSAMVRERPQLVLHPTGQMPAVNVP